MADSRINLYHNLSVMLDAGVPITRALQTVHKQGKYGRVFRMIEREVAAGSSVTDAVDAHRRRFEKLDRTLIEVGEQTGQSAEMFEELSRWYAFRQRLNRAVRSGMLLPVLYIHATAFIVPVVPCALSGFDPMIYLSGVFHILAMFYIPAAVILGILFLTPKNGPLRWAMDIVVMGVPLLGKAIRELELSRFCNVFAITYKAGVPIVESARMATEAVTNLVMRRQLAGGYEKARVGDSMSEGFSRMLPGEFFGIWQVGEESGDLDDSAKRLADMHAYNAEVRFNAIAQWTPRLVYGIVCVVMIYYIFKGYSQIYGGLSF
jgi:type II secretory pathway component PulF